MNGRRYLRDFMGWNRPRVVELLKTPTNKQCLHPTEPTQIVAAQTVPSRIRRSLQVAIQGAPVVLLSDDKWTGIIANSVRSICSPAN